MALEWSSLVQTLSWSAEASLLVAVVVLGEASVVVEGQELANRLVQLPALQVAAAKVVEGVVVVVAEEEEVEGEVVVVVGVEAVEAEASLVAEVRA